MALNGEIVEELADLSVKEETVETEKDLKVQPQQTKDLECYQEILKNTNELQEQINELCAKVDHLEVQNKPVLVQSQDQLLSLQEFCRVMSEQVASIEAIQNLQTQEFQQKILETDEMRLQLLGDLKKQEESHLEEMELQRLKLTVELEAKDKQCLELEQEIFRCKEHDDISVSCSICLEKWNSSSDHRLVSLQCGHLFGDKCIRSCLQRIAECPQCRADASPHEIRYIYGRPL